MTLEEYRISIENINIPEDMDWFDGHTFYMKEVGKFRSQLSEADLKIVLEEQHRWEAKMQAGVGKPTITRD